MTELRIAARQDVETLVPLIMAYHRFEEVDMPEPVVRQAIALCSAAAITGGSG